MSAEDGTGTQPIVGSVGQRGQLQRAKLRRPVLPSDLVPRSRLVDWMGREPRRGITLVCAEAGAGKTTMLCEWLKESQLRSAWLSLDSEDLHVFGRYLATAIDALFPGALSSTFDVLAEPDITPDRLARALAAEIDDLPAPFALVLDDYHTIRDPRVHDTVEALSRHLPLNLRLVISGRSEPPFALARGLSVGLVDELQPESLRFTLDEAASFLSKTSGTVVSPEAARPILDRSQGWPTGLRFAALGARARRSIEGIGALRWDQDRLVREYFLDEVLLRQPPQVRWFLLSTSIVERFSAPLCAEILRRDVPDDTRGGHDRVRDHTRSALISPFEGAIRAAQRTIDRLVEGNLFLTPLDERHTWYRYHPLFKQALLARLESTTTPGFVAQLRLRASLWHEANGFVEEAVHLAVLSGDVATACQIAERNTQSALDRQDVFEVERWLRWLPEDSVRLSPGLMAMRAWVELVRGEMRLDLLLTQAETALARRRESQPDELYRLIEGQIETIWAALWRFRGDPQRALSHARRALDLLESAGSRWVRGSALAMVAFGLAATDQVEPAVDAIDRALTTEPPESPAAISLIYSSMVLRLAQGQPAEAVRVGAAARDAGSASAGYVGYWIRFSAGVACYELGDLDAAREHFRAVVAGRARAHVLAYRDSILGLALVQQLSGHTVEADELVEMLAGDVAESGRGWLTVAVRSFRARLALLGGRLAEAERWLGELTEPSQYELLLEMETPTLTQASVLLARGDRSSLNRALEILARPIRLPGPLSRTSVSIKSLALRALAEHGLGRVREAEDLLREAVRLAEDGGYARVLVDLGVDVTPLLRQLFPEAARSAYLKRVLADCLVRDARTENRLRADPASPVEGDPTSAPSTGHLTAREIEVIRLLGERLTNQEIAEILAVSVLTVKKHTANIYEKLDVRGRREAVARARALGLIPRV